MPFMKKLMHDALNEYFDAREEIFGQKVKKWDGYSFDIYPPTSLDDNACIEVVLNNRDGSSMTAMLSIGGRYEE
jgi:hypothetical protein